MPASCAFRGFLISLVTLGTFGVVACSGAKPTEFGAFEGNGVSPSTSGTVPSPEAGSPPSSPEAGTVDGSMVDGSKPDDGTTLCDDGLSLTSTNAMDAAKALGLCSKTTVKSARYVKPDGTPIANPESWGLLTKLGPNVPTHGKTMLALSTGAARAPGDPGYQAPSGYDKGYTHAAPTGQPREASVCTDTTMAPGAPHDGVALELQLHVPASAKSLSFNHMLFTTDYPTYICSQYNDVFLVLMDPKPAVIANSNVVFDSHGDAVSVNTASLLRACTASTSGTINFACPLGTSSLVGTGFDDKASTGWLTTTVPVTGSTDITLRFMIWDSGDGIQDSTVLVDEVAFSSTPAATTQTVPR